LGHFGHRAYTRDDNAFAFFSPATSAFDQGRFVSIDRTSSYSTRLRGQDTTVWHRTSQYWGMNTASVISALLGTAQLARPQNLRVIYQMHDAYGNTRVTSPGRPTVNVAGGSNISCSTPDPNSGIGECSGTLSSSLFRAAGMVSLSLTWQGSVALADFASVSVQKEPQWSMTGGTGDHTGWNSPSSTITENVAFGIALPYEDVFLRIDASQTTFQAHVYLKTFMSEATAAQRQIEIGKFKVRFPSSVCSISGVSNRHSSFATWEILEKLPAGECFFSQHYMRVSSGHVQGSE
jgi:hypothetical protein